jgi:protein-S-isoprenylcysteine O-methyltransferase Ste14
LLAAAALHLAFRLAYLLWIGSTLRGEDLALHPPGGSRERWLAFRRRAGLILRADALSFVAVCAVSAGSLPVGIPAAYRVAAGIVLVAAGVTAKASAYRVIGPEGYYWYDFFLPPEERRHLRRGIYRYFRNPMYGPGYLHAFGLALLLASGWGLAIALFDWLAVWTFYVACERPAGRLARRRKAGL